jgi:hypothetical protein
VRETDRLDDDRGKRGWAQFTYPERHPGANLQPLSRNSICLSGFAIYFVGDFSRRTCGPGTACPAYLMHYALEEVTPEMFLPQRR